MNLFFQKTILCALVVVLVCVIPKISISQEEKTDKPVSATGAQEREKCQWGDSGKQQANEIISKWMRDNKWSTSYIFMLQDKSAFKGNDYCAAYTWDANTEVWFYFKSNGSTIELVGFEKKLSKAK